MGVSLVIGARGSIGRHVVDHLLAAARGGSPVTDSAERVLGRPALPFTRWATDHAADFR